MFSILRDSGFKAMLLLVVLTIGSGALQATNTLTATPSTVAVTCSTTTGPGAGVSVVVKPVTSLTGSATITVSVGSLPSGVVVTAPASQILNTTNQSSGLTYTVKLANGCVGASTGSVSFHFFAGGTSDVLVTVNETVTATTSALTVSPTPITVTCARIPGSPATYVPGPSQTVSVTSAATGGTPFTVDTTTSAPANWLSVNPTTGGTATTAATTFTLTAATGCGGFAAGSTNSTTIHLLNSPAPDKLLPVTLQVLPPSPLTANPNPASLSYTKGSGTPGHADVAIASASSPAPFFTIDTTTLPIWLTADSTTGTVPKTIRFSSTSVSDTLAPGTYSASVHVKVSNYAVLSVPVSLSINNTAPQLSVSEGITRNVNWTVGTALPTPYITLVSSDSPIPYTVTTGGNLAPIIAANELKGLAYSFGTAIPVTFDPTVFAAAQPGTTLTGTVSFTWGNPASTIVVTFNVAILSPAATLTSASPASIPTAPAGQVFTVVLTGNNFVASLDPTQKTKVGVVSSGNLITDANISSNVVNVSSMILTITVPTSADTYLPFSPTGQGGTVILGVCNPVGGTCTVPTGTTTLAIGSNPIIQAVTSASSYLQVTPPAVQTIAPYDMLSIFGINFCSSGGTGCNSSQVLYGAPDAITRYYPSSLSPDASSSTQRSLSVTFQTHATPPVVIANAPLLFATNSQINLLVPAAVSAQISGSVDIVVNFGYGTGATMHSSTPFTVNVAATNPGVFTIGADGQGAGAILGPNWALIAAGQEAGMRSTATDSDIVQIYMTGLGLPDSIADNASAGSGYSWSADCVTVASYLASLNLSASSSVTVADGAVIQASLLNTNRLAPCIKSNSTNVPSVTVGGVAGVVTYAGWVADSIAGLYQVNVRLPGSGAGPFTATDGTSVATISAPVQLPVVVRANGNSSQTGVSLWVAPRLKVAAPGSGGLTGRVGVNWPSSSNAVVATEGTSPYRYSLTSGLLPAGVTLSAAGVLSGMPAANTAGSYVVTVTATDSAHVPVTGTVTFTLTVQGGLVMNESGTAPFNAVFGTASPALTTVVATGGVYPYTYTISSPSPLPVGMAIDFSGGNGGVVSTSTLTPAGTYHVTVQASDSSTPALTGSITFDVVVALHISNTSPVAGANGAASNITTVTATGATGSITYSLDTATQALGWVSIDSSTGIVSITDSAPASTTKSVTVTATDGTAAPGAATAGTANITFTLTISS